MDHIDFKMGNLSKIYNCYIAMFLFIVLYNGLYVQCSMNENELNKTELRLQAKEMFMHGYKSYMKYAYPHDELMPLSCNGRIRGVTPTRGDVDDALGNFSLTLVDALDTLVVIGELDEFEKAVDLIVTNVQFDSDLVVSVFETNIRMIGGLLSGHILVKLLQSQESHRLTWYTNELLEMAADLADRLLPAFNTTSGLPYSRINLRYGMLDYLKQQGDTCTACGGTMILEFAALSRLTGKTIYEEKARKAMDFLWSQRHRGTDLMGTVLNVHSGDWIRRDAGIGAGIDSYYEYCLKTYILLGDDDYLQRFNKHYEAIMRYVSRGPLFIDVHMHKPTVAARSFMDALLAFWPGVQVLKGDLKSAIEFHETLYQVIKRHRFLPEAFTHDLQVHWAQHPIRPEFIESTYLLYRATKDPYYLEVAKNVMDSMNEFLRVDCGFAAVKDLRSMTHEDRMDSFVLSETLKYLYMIYSEPSDLILDPDNYVLTTEAHFLPLSIGDIGNFESPPRRILIDPDELIDDSEAAKSKKYRSACPSVTHYKSAAHLADYANDLRTNIQSLVRQLTKRYDGQASCPTQSQFSFEKTSVSGNDLHPWTFNAGNPEHLRKLRELGVHVQVHSDGRLQMTHSSSLAVSAELALQGSHFINEMIQFASQVDTQQFAKVERFVQILSQPYFGKVFYKASPAHFGTILEYKQVEAKAELASPFRGCRLLINDFSIKNKIAIIQRKECMFQEKARFAQEAGAVAVIIVDDIIGTSSDTSPPFAMSGDTNIVDDIAIPVVFLYNKEGTSLIEHISNFKGALIRISDRLANPAYVFEKFLLRQSIRLQRPSNKVSHAIKRPIIINASSPSLLLNFRFASVNIASDIVYKYQVIEENLEVMKKIYKFQSTQDTENFYAIILVLASSILGIDIEPSEDELKYIGSLLPQAIRLDRFTLDALPNELPTSVACSYVHQNFICSSFDPESFLL